MKFRTVLCVAALAVVPALATGDLMTTETVGWLKVTSTAKSTIVSVPWIQVGSDGSSVQVAKLVKTDSLKAGVMLYYYDGSAYWAWTMQETTPGSGVTNWIPTIVTSGVGPQSTSASKDTDFALLRGKALFVYRPHGAEDGDIYLYGKYASPVGVSTQVAQGSAENPAYTLLANPGTTEVNLNDVGKSGTIAGGEDGDKIVVPGVSGANEKEYTYDSSKGEWGYLKEGTTPIFPGISAPRTWSNEALIPTGRGVWYVSKGGSPTFTF